LVSNKLEKKCLDSLEELGDDDEIEEAKIEIKEEEKKNKI